MRTTNNSPCLDKLELFDSCLTLGEFVLSSCPECVTAENIISILNHYHIKEALVHDHNARVNYPREHSNERLLGAIKDISRLHPVFVIDPDYLCGYKSPENLVQAMLQKGVKSVRLPMLTFPPLPWLWQELCYELEKHQIPCFLDFGDTSTKGSLTTADVDGIRLMALTHPELPLVISHVMGGLGVHPALIPMMKQTHNTYIDGLGILEFWRRVAMEIGPERVLFATGMPFTDPGIMISDIQYAVGFNETEKKLMAGDNLRRLLGKVK